MTDFEAGSEARVARVLLKGGLVPLLGAGVNACGRSDDFTWSHKDKHHLPTGGELATYLATEFNTPEELRDSKDLILVSQFIDSVLRSGDDLHEALSEIFDADYDPGPVHVFLARAAKILRDRGELQVILTTNYDDLLERALDEAGEPYDLITYIASAPAEYRGRFMHWAPPAKPGEPPPEPKVIEDANTYSLGAEKRTVIVKLHGAVQRSLSEKPEDNGGPPEVQGEEKIESYVITEDDYIEYLTNTDIAGRLPIAVTQKLRNSSYLFLGYGMKDWNLRAILRRLWGDMSQRQKPSWAIQNDVEPLERAFWDKRGVDILEYDLKEYIELLNGALDARIKAEAE